MNARIAMPLLLIVMTAGPGALVRGQGVRVQGDRTQDCSCNEFYSKDSASGKEELQTHMHGHDYRMISVHNKTTEFYVDDKKIDESDYPKYAQVIDRIKLDMREAEKDQEEAKRDQEEARRDQEEAKKDQEEARRDEEEARRDQAQARVDQEDAKRDQEEAKRDQEEARRDQEEARRDQEQGRRDRQQAEDDRVMMRSLVSYIVAQGVVPDIESLKSMVLTDTAFIVNGVKQPQKLLDTLKDKFGVWARNGLSYGNHQAPGTTVFFYKENFE